MTLAAQDDREISYEDLLVDDVSTEFAQTRGIQLIDARQRYLAILRDRVAASDSGTLQAFSTGKHALHKVLSCNGSMRRVRDLVGKPFDSQETGLVHSGRALATLGLALVGGPGSASEHLAVFQEWMDHAGLRVPSGLVRDVPSDIRPPHREVLEQFAKRGELDPLALVWMLELDGWLHPRQGKPRVRTGPGVQVLLDLGPAGQRAELRLSSVRGLPPALIPDPAALSLASADQEFQAALTAAWQIAGGPRSHTVLWSLRDLSGPVLRVGGSSAGAAFTVLLDENQRLHRRALGPLTVRRLQPSNAIVGAVHLDEPDAIRSVSGYETKLKVVTDKMRIILPRTDMTAATEADRGGFADLTPVDTWRDAAKAARRIATRRLLGIAASTLGALLIILAVLAATIFVPQARDSAADDLLASARELRGVDEPSSIVLSAAAQRARSRPDTVLATLTALLDNQGTVALVPTYTPARHLGIGADGRRIMVLEQDDRLVVWAIDSAGAHVAQTESGVSAMAVSMDGRFVAIGDRSGRVQIRNASTWSMVATWDGPDSTGTRSRAVQSVSFDAEGRYLAAAAEKSERVRLWDISTGEFSDRVFSPRYAPISRLGFTTGGVVVAEMGFDVIKDWALWEPRQDTVRPIEHRPPAREDLLVGPDTVIARCNEQGQVELLEPETNQPVPEVAVPPRCLTHAVAMAGARTLYVDVPMDNYLQPQQPRLMVFDNVGHWTTVRGRQRPPLPNGVIPSPDGPYALSATANLVASYDSGAVRVTRLPSQRQQDDSMPAKAQFLRDDSLLVLRDNGHLQRIDAAGDVVTTVSLPHIRADFSIAPDETRVAVIGRDGYDGQFRLRQFTLPELEPLGNAVVVDPPEATQTHDVGVTTLDDGRLVVRVDRFLMTYAVHPDSAPASVITLSGASDGFDWQIMARPQTAQVALATPDGAGLQLIDVDTRTAGPAWGPLPSGHTRAIQFHGRRTALALGDTSTSLIDLDHGTVETRPMLGELPPEAADGVQILTGWPRLLGNWGFDPSSQKIWADTPVDGQRFKTRRLLLSPSGDRLAVLDSNLVDVVPTNPADWRTSLCAMTSAAHGRIRSHLDPAWLLDPC